MSYLESVLPVIRKDKDRLMILDRSIEKFFPDLKLCWCVVPKDDLLYFKNLLNKERYQIICEEDLIPELAIHRNIDGWFKQQLIKFAIAEHITSDFYLTLDADVIVVKPVSYMDLIINRKAIVKRSKRDYHSEWYKWATRVLGIPRSGYTHGVTPSIFSKEAVLRLQEYLERRINAGIQVLCKLLRLLNNTSLKSHAVLPRKKWCGWRNFLIRNLPWTEYSLYHTFLEGTGLFDKYHIDGRESVLYFYNSVWEKKDFEKWNPEECFLSEERAWFAVVQSNTGITADETWEKIKKFL